MWRDFLFHLLLYLCNHVVNRVPSRRLRLAFYRLLMGFEIGPGSFIFMGATFDTRRGLRIGINSVVNQNCRIDSRGGVTIGDNVSISADVCVLTADHDLHVNDAVGKQRPVTIGDHAFIGTRAMILPGVNVGCGAAVAAGAVVSRDVPSFTIVAGVPARPIGERPRTLAYSASYSRLFA